MARKLVEASTPEKFDLGGYRDEYTGKLLTLIQSKSGQVKSASGKGRDHPGVINLMDALRKSLDEMGKPTAHQASGVKKRRSSSRRKTG